MDIGRITQAYTALKIKSLDEQVGKLAISQSSRGLGLVACFKGQKINKK
jgi:hypothetical protein